MYLYYTYHFFFNFYQKVYCNNCVIIYKHYRNDFLLLRYVKYIIVINVLQIILKFKLTPTNNH